MSRKVNHPKAAPHHPTAPFDAPTIASTGGAPGIESAPNPQMRPFTGIAPGTPSKSVVVAETRPDIPPPRRYRVTHGAKILWGGAFADIKTGKEFDEGVYDIAFLESRGIHCIDITPKPKAPPAPPKEEPKSEPEKKTEDEDDDNPEST